MATAAAAGFHVAKILAMKLKNLILFILNLFKRALCIFRKRSPASPVLPVVVADTRSAAYDIPEEVVDGNDDVSASWDSWDAAEFQTGAAAAASNSYQTQSAPPSELPLQQQQPPPPSDQAADADDADEEPDYFADMTPASFKAPKIVVKKKSPHSSSVDGVAAGASSNSLYSNRLAVADNASDGLALAPPQELEAMDDWDHPVGEENMWADEENEELDWEVEFALRETRRQELERKKWEQQQRRMQREMQKARTHSQTTTTSSSSSSATHFQTIQSTMSQ